MKAIKECLVGFFPNSLIEELGKQKNYIGEVTEARLLPTSRVKRVYDCALGKERAVYMARIEYPVICGGLPSTARVWLQGVEEPKPRVIGGFGGSWDY